MTLKDELFKAGTGVHKAILRMTGGRVLGRLGGMPVVVLTTTGRKTGAKRTTVLTSPVQDGDRVVLVASYGGDDRHPAWYLNISRHPDASIEMDGITRAMRARTATDAEAAVLWPRVESAYSGYAGYRRKTGRTIPLIILEPAGGMLRRL